MNVDVSCSERTRVGGGVAPTSHDHFSVSTKLPLWGKAGLTSLPREKMVDECQLACFQESEKSDTFT